MKASPMPVDSFGDRMKGRPNCSGASSSQSLSSRCHAVIGPSICRAPWITAAKAGSVGTAIGSTAAAGGVAGTAVAAGAGAADTEVAGVAPGAPGICAQPASAAPASPIGSQTPRRGAAGRREDDRKRIGEPDKDSSAARGSRA
jgi:hypothetical protein